LTATPSVSHTPPEAYWISYPYECGLGQLTREQITHYKNVFELELMRKIKQALDPLGLMNPEKMI
jgi:FAD/FMN-containing dehydrogenase